MNDILKDLLSDLEAAGNEKNAAAMDAYMKNKAKHFGLKAALRREVAKPYLEASKTMPWEEKKKLVKLLWEQPWRECHHIAQEILEKGIKKHLVKEDISFLEYLITTNSWWDTVDFVAPKMMGVYFQKFPDQIVPCTNKWLASNNIWLQRSALLFQLKYKDKTDLSLLFELCLRLTGTKEFFINKAIGWVLRENHYRIPDQIEEFVELNRDKLSNLSVREALKHANNG